MKKLIPFILLALCLAGCSSAAELQLQKEQQVKDMRYCIEHGFGSDIQMEDVVCLPLSTQQLQ